MGGADPLKALKLQVIPIESLFGLQAVWHENKTPLQLFQDAKVIFGRDVTTGNHFLVFGKLTLRAVASKHASDAVTGLMIEVPSSDEYLRSLLTLTVAIKGRHDYAPTN